MSSQSVIFFSKAASIVSIAILCGKFLCKQNCYAPVLRNSKPPQILSEPKLEEILFHWCLRWLMLQISLCDEEALRVSEPDNNGKTVTVMVCSGDQSWMLRRTWENFRMLDIQLHRCIYDRKLSNLPQLLDEPPEAQVRELLLHRCVPFIKLKVLKLIPQYKLP